MQLGNNLTITQSQKLHLTAGLKQSLDILQFNQFELVGFINEEVLNNPVLECKSDIEIDVAPQSDLAPSIDYYEDDYSTSYKRNSSDTDKSPIDQYVFKQTLHDHLNKQICLLSLDSKSQSIYHYLLGNLNYDGYLEITCDELATRFALSLDEADTYIQQFQNLDPHGVGARDLRECLLIQLTYLGLKNSLAYKMADKHLDDIANNKLSDISLQLNEPIDRIKTAKEVIQHLDPTPGSRFNNEEDTQYIIPDILIEKKDNDYVILFNDRSYVPKLSINSYYSQLSSDKSIGKDTMAYIHSHMTSASKLIQNIEQRKQTIREVALVVFKYQRDFLDKGISGLKILNMEDIAEELDLHKSTVSRAVAGKYIQCHRGTYPLKYFFQSGIKSSSGISASSESIKAIIKDIIAGEPKKKPLSDQAIANELNTNGINISRRTVAKYRDALNLPSASKRKLY